MTTIIKSNKPFTGSTALGSLSRVTKTANDLYDDYDARVTLDGGKVQDPAATLAAITAALKGDYFYRTAFAVSPRWGIKTTGSAINKFYSLVGSVDGVCVGSVDLDTTTAAFNLAVLNTEADKIDFAGASLLKGSGMCMGIAAYTSSTASKLTFTTGGELWANFTYNVTRLDIAGTTGKFAANPEYAVASLDAHTILVEMGAKRFSGVQNGTLKKVMTGTFTEIASGATATVSCVLGSGSNLRISELWHLDDANQAAAMNLSQDMGDRT